MLVDYICGYSYGSLQLIQNYAVCRCEIWVLKRILDVRNLAQGIWAKVKLMIFLVKLWGQTYIE